MTKPLTNETHLARRQWLAVLARASRPALEVALAEIGELPPLEHVRPSEAGMVMLRGRVGGTGDAFNLGEASVARCALRVGDSALGVGYALGRDKRKAELIAIFDALLQDDLNRARLEERIIAPLSRQQAGQREAAVRNAAASKVEFFTFVRGEA